MKSERYKARAPMAAAYGSTIASAVHALLRELDGDTGPDPFVTVCERVDFEDGGYTYPASAEVYRGPARRAPGI
jgi:hypothetical protein